MRTTERQQLMELVSVVVPAYNAEAFIRESIQSALQQTYPLIEVVVVDDCSSDATAVVTAQIAAADPRVRLLRNPTNVGPAAARNRGIAEAQGTWIALLDADDAFEPERIEKLLGEARQDEYDIVSDNLLLLPADGDLPQIMLPRSQIAAPRLMTATDFIKGNVTEQRAPRVSYGFMKPLIRRSFLATHGLRYQERIRFGEDYILAVQCLLKGARWLILPDPLYRYRVRSGSLSVTASATDLNEIRAFDEQCLREDPMVAVNPYLAHAFRRHKAAIDRWYYYLRFTRAVKAKSFGEAAHLLLGRPVRFWHIMMECIRQAPVITAKALGGGYWKGALAAGVGRTMDSGAMDSTDGAQSLPVPSRRRAGENCT